MHALLTQRTFGDIYCSALHIDIDVVLYGKDPSRSPRAKSRKSGGGTGTEGAADIEEDASGHGPQTVEDSRAIACCVGRFWVASKTSTTVTKVVG